MLPVKRVIASATRACSVASASSRSRRALRVAILRSRTELRPGGFGEGLVGDPGPAERPLALPFPTGGMFTLLALEPDLSEPELSQSGSALSNRKEPGDNRHLFGTEALGPPLRLNRPLSSNSGKLDSKPS